MSYQSEYSGAQVDEAVGKALNPDATPTQNSTNLVQSGGVFGLVSNRNLLDNGWFTVNQRGVADGTTTAGNGYFADRWQATGNGVQRVAGGGISVLGTAFHKLDSPGIAGKTVTFSILYSDGTVSSNSFEWTGTSFSKTFANGTVNFYPSANQINMNTQSVNVTAVKLELGSVSTLANDAPPCFAEELAKCQRYFYNTGATSSSIVVLNGIRGDASAGKNIAPQVITPVVMRTTPTVDATVHSIRGNGSIWNSNLSVSNTPLSFLGNVVTLNVQCSTASFPAYTNGYAVLFSKLQLSADL